MDTLTLLIVAGAACLLWEWWRRKALSPHSDEITATTEEIEQVVAEIQELQQQLGSAANSGDYAQAIAIGERMLELSDNHFGDDPEVILPLLAALSNFYHLAGQPLKAIPHLQRSILLREKFPDLHADQADSLGQLADLYLQQETPHEALSLIRREVDLRRHNPPDEALLHAQCKLLSLNLEEPMIARLLRQDIATTARQLNPQVVANLANESNSELNEALRKNQIRNAWAAAEQAALLAAVAQPDAEITYVCRSNLAEMLRRNRRFEEAETHFLQLIAELEERNNDAEGLRIAYNNLALLYDDIGHASDAAKWRERQLLMLQTAEVSIETRFNALNNLAVSQANRGDNETAAHTYAEALTLSPEGHGVNPRIWADTLNNYGITLVNLKRLPAAGRIYQKVLERKKAGLDIPSLTVASSFNGLGMVSIQLGKLEQAQNMFERALALKKKNLPADDPSLETTFHNLGSVYAQRGDAVSAIKMAQQVLSSREKRLGRDHPETQSARRNLEAATTALQPTTEQPTIAQPVTREDIDALMVQATGAQLFRYATYDFGRSRDPGVSMVLVPEEQAFSFYRKLTLNLPQGWRCFIGSTRWLGEEKHDGMAELVAIQAASQFDCLRIARTDAVNHDLNTEDIIRTLQDYDQRFGIRIYSASTDTVGFILLRLPADLDAFAQELLDFCMDLEDTELIKQMITTSGNRVELWWD